ncbi:MAG: efflux RND transporter periplasmic adaptor subunit [Nitrosomonadales bacterium]|nr:efflux RND transporter periplasmic adaptor subunit [Nitrosomonadales bacterium]
MSKLIKGSLWIVLALGAAGAAAWWLAPKKISAEARYATAALERGAITQTVSANGTLNPVTLVSIGSQVSGIVKKLHADFNDHVKAGQVLLELDPALIEAQVWQSDASVASANASLELAQANEARMRSLYAQEYVSKQELDQTVQALKAAQAQLAVAQAQAARDRTNLGYTVIRSPVSGVVVSRDVDIGQTVAASFQTPTLFKIAQDLSHMQIDTSYAEADVGNIRVGQQATFRVDAFPNRTFHGEVRQVRLNPTTQQNVVTYDVVVSVDNPEQVLMPGMTAYVNILIAQRKDVLMVPNAALRFRPSDAGARQDKARSNGDKPAGERGPRGEHGKDKGDAMPMGTVYVLENGQPKPVRIPVGITDNRMTEVSGGELKEGDTVIVEDRQPPEKKGGGAGMRLF